MEIEKKYGIIKGILWHQGENDQALCKQLKYMEINLKNLLNCSEMESLYASR